MVVVRRHCGGADPWGLRLAHRRLLLSRAKHPSLQGHVRLAKRLARLVPFYEYAGERFFASDGAPPDVAAQRRTGFDRLADHPRGARPADDCGGEEIEPGVSDVQFTKLYRVPFQYRRYVARRLRRRIACCRPAPA